MSTPMTREEIEALEARHIREWGRPSDASIHTFNCWICGVVAAARYGLDLRDAVLSVCDGPDFWDPTDFDKGRMHALDAIRAAVEGVK